MLPWIAFGLVRFLIRGFQVGPNFSSVDRKLVVIANLIVCGTGNMYKECCYQTEKVLWVVL